MIKSEKILSMLNFKGGSLDANAAAQVEELKALLIDDIRKEENRKNGKANIEKAAKAILKSAKQMRNKNIDGSWIKDGKQYVCDAKRILRIDSPIDLPELEKDATPYNVEMIINEFYCKKTIEINIPSLTELKSELKILKAAKNGNCYIVRLENGQLVDMQFIIDALQGFGNDYKCKVFAINKKLISPIMLENDELKEVILPINPGAHVKSNNKKYFAIWR